MPPALPSFHIHVRDPKSGLASRDPALFARSWKNPQPQSRRDLNLTGAWAAIF